MTQTTAGKPRAEQLAEAASRRLDVLSIIEASISERGYPPAVRELAEQTGVSKRTIRADLDHLVSAGHIERDAGEHRGIRLVTP